MPPAARALSPTTLQGLWNDLIFPPWNSNYTVNINTEMNYWPTDRVNLPECFEPMERLLRELAESGERTAREYYGAPGFVCHHNTDLWRMTTPVGAHRKGSAVFAFWPMASGWLSRHLWEHYEFTRDEDFLRNQAYPILKKAAAFYKAMLVEDTDGTLVFAPATSPENHYLLDGESYSVAASTTMNIAIIRECFEMVLKAGEALGEQSDGELEALLRRLKPFEIGREGQMLEWSEELQEEKIHHRHISHLYGLYPAHQITPEETPELAEACRRSLERRGDDGPGWSLGWKVNQWARLHDGDHALKLIDRQLITVEGRNPSGFTLKGALGRSHGGSYLNLLDAYPPFQIDGNFGVCSGISEMLLRDRAGWKPPDPARSARQVEKRQRPRPARPQRPDRGHHLAGRPGGRGARALIRANRESCRSNAAAFSLYKKRRPFLKAGAVAERVGFEPTVPSLVHLISSQGRYNHFDTAPHILANQNITYYTASGSVCQS